MTRASRSEDGSMHGPIPCLLILAVLLASACPLVHEVRPAHGGYQASLRWTQRGVPHIVATDLGGLGFGQGYAQARAHLCVIADTVVRIRGERARYLGRGVDGVNLRSDLAHLHLGYRARGEAMLRSASADTRDLLTGFAAGYSHALALTPPSARPAACRDAAWLQPISAGDVAGIVVAVQGLGTARFLIEAIASAQPGAGPRAGAPISPSVGASNGWAIGGDRTTSGGGIVIANPHFPWQGDLLFHEAQLTVPGSLDVYGASLVGVPGIEIGTGPTHAWTHTWSPATHLVLYRLALTADSALAYRRGNDTVSMIGTVYRVKIAGEGGHLTEEAHTLYRSAVGPMVVLPGMPWERPGGHAMTLRDVTVSDRLEVIDQYLAMARARGRAEFERALATHSLGFLHTLYADATGETMYADSSLVPALSDEALERWRQARATMPEREAAWQSGLVVLDGSDPANDLIDVSAATPGAVVRSPRIARRDFVMNANNSFRFTNLDAPEIHDRASPLWGDDEGAPDPRTLENLRALSPRLGDSGADDRFTLDEAIASLLSNRSLVAERMVPDVLEACAAAPPPAGQVARACSVLRSWDRRYGIESRGAVLWREWLAAVGGLRWRRGFDGRAASETPTGVAASVAEIRAALGAAAASLDEAHLALDVRLGDVQTARGRAGLEPVPGGIDGEGVANMAYAQGLDATLLPRALNPSRYPVDHGTSFVLAVELTPAGRTVKALLTYGNSSDPASLHYRDQLGEFARGALRTVPLTDASIAADPEYRLETISSP